MPSQIYFVSLIASYGLLVTVSFSSTPPPTPAWPKQQQQQKTPLLCCGF